MGGIKNWFAGKLPIFWSNWICASGQWIRQDCDLCHNLLAYEEKEWHGLPGVNPEELFGCLATITGNKSPRIFGWRYSHRPDHPTGRQ